MRRVRPVAPGRSRLLDLSCAESASAMSRPDSFIVCFCLFCLTATPRAGRGAPQQIAAEPETVLLPAGPGERPFNVTRHMIPIREIEPAGPPRDGIPAIFRPRFLRATQVGQVLKDSDRVIGVFLNDQAKAYPVQVLNYHELVNDEAGGRPILVSW
jgi:hypothetical protein